MFLSEQCFVFLCDFSDHFKQTIPEEFSTDWYYKTEFQERKVYCCM